MSPKETAPIDFETLRPSTGTTSDQADDVSGKVQQTLARWTDEQEIALLKGVVRWKPVGMHKHFRIIAIHNYMIGQGVINPGDEHTSIPGLWMKLGSLYNLPILDEREDSMLQSASDESGSPDELYYPFDLPESECGAMKFEKRINLEGSQSPALLDSRRESTIADTDEPSSSPVPGRQGTRATRRGRRVSKLQHELETSRRVSPKAASVTGDETMADAGKEEAENADGSDDNGNDGKDAEEKLPKARSTRRSRALAAGKGGRGRGGTGSTGRVRRK